MFVIFTTLLLCGGLAYTILEFRRENLRPRRATPPNGDKAGAALGGRR
jgi:hypothetical protein